MKSDGKKKARKAGAGCNKLITYSKFIDTNVPAKLLPAPDILVDGLRPFIVSLPKKQAQVVAKLLPANL